MPIEPNGTSALISPPSPSSYTFSIRCAWTFRPLHAGHSSGYILNACHRAVSLYRESEPDFLAFSQSPCHAILQNHGGVFLLCCLYQGHDTCTACTTLSTLCFSKRKRKTHHREVSLLGPRSG